MEAVKVLLLAIVKVPVLEVTVSPLMLVAVAAPRTGVVKVGLVAKTKRPEPVSSVTAEARLALDGVAKKVATPVPNPLTPVEIGNPVALVSVPEVGVPKIGVTKVGLVAKTEAPLPVSSDKEVARAEEVIEPVAVP